MNARVSWRLLSAGVVLVFFTTYGNCCPSVCQCFTRNGQNIVDCSEQNLSSIPANLPSNVTILNLSGNSIEDLTNVFREGTSTNTSFLGNFWNLKSLSLANNTLKFIEPSTFHNLSSLTHLDLSYNKLSNISADTFVGLQHLLSLELSGNQDILVTNNSFHGLSSLKNLYLSKTGVTLQNLRIPVTLEHLYLEGNYWEDFNPSFLENLTSLNLLDLSSNNLTLLENFPSLQSLKTLDLSQNNIQVISQEAFRLMPNLHTLNLDNNPLFEITGAPFYMLSKLQYLSISQMPNLFFLDQTTFRGLFGLFTLQMSSNPNLEFVHISLFTDLVNVKLINISQNMLTALHPIMFQMMGNVSVDIQGNNFECNCDILWIVEQNNMPNIHVTDISKVNCYHSEKSIKIIDLNLGNLHCGEISVQANRTKVAAKIGSSVILECKWNAYPPPLISWVTPRGRRLIFYPSHPLVERSHPTEENVMEGGLFHANHLWHNSSSYVSDLIEYSDRLVILSNGGLFIDYMLRSDSGPYKCIVENSKNSSSVEIVLQVDMYILTEIKVWSILIGLACAASFFMLNLVYVLISALVRRCINQRRREAILKLVENIDQYKSAQLARLKDNYYYQLNRIRDGYHNQFERIRENYSNQSMRFKSGASQRREWASNKLDTLRENYNNQVTRLKENSAQKLEHLRDTYNNQLLRIRDYGSTQMARIHKKYKLQQRHVIKLLETMNFDNCRQIIDSECVRAESMIFETNLTHPDLNIPSPTDSDLEYQTASSNNDTPESSQIDLRQIEAECLVDSSDEQPSQTEAVCLVTTRHDPSSHQAGVDLLVEIESSHLVMDNSSPSFQDTSSHLNGGSSEGEFDAGLCNYDEIDQLLVQIQLIDESDDENEKSKDFETCV